jgi:peroxiredoxin
LEGNLIPAFELPRAGGGRVRLRAYRGRRSLALFFLHGAGCATCQVMLAAIALRYGDYALVDAEPLAILPDDPAAADAFRRALSLPFPVLSDCTHTVRNRYGAGAGAALLIADRFGVPVLWQQAGAGHDLPDQDTVLRELAYLAHTCSAGCATPIWPSA